ncbi:MAG TPA: major capsid family protein [Acidobacteriaceae bacterium]|jgi:hypothetical protein
MIKRTSRSQAQAFDAAGPSGKVFLSSALTLIDPIVTLPLMAQTAERDIFIRYGGGYSDSIQAWNVNYGDPTAGDAALQGTNNTSAGVVDVDLQAETWDAKLWTKSFFISKMDLGRMQQASTDGRQPPVALQQIYNDVIDATWRKYRDQIVYIGRQNTPGLVNNPNVAATTVSAAWSADGTTPLEMLTDLNSFQNQALAASGYDAAQGMPNRMLIPYSVFGVLSQPMNSAASISTIDYLEKYCIATKAGADFKIMPLPDPWLAGQGVGSTLRSVIYRNEQAALDVWIPMPPQVSGVYPSERNGGGYTTIFHGNVGPVRWKRETTALYADGI